ncbi:hypothetical protein MKR66_13050 [Acinetobacter baumannii]
MIDAGSSPAWRARFKGSVLNESLSSSNYGESAVIKPIEFETFTPALVGLFIGESKWTDMESVMVSGLVDYGHNRSEEEFRNL